MVTHSGRADHVGFDGIRFQILASRGEGVYPDWDWPDTDIRHHIPGSNITIYQNMGCPAVPITFRLHFPDVDDYFALRRRQGVTGVLTLLAGFTSAAGETYHDLGTDYEDLDQVRLARVSNGEIAPGRQFAECDATFTRSMDPLTGQAVSS